ncbi:MAG: ferrous iron transport protein B [Acutalibacteraceae bacterium]
MAGKHQNDKKTDNIHSYTVALAGNPNVGKSTVFNALTGMKQHTGNWPGKTVSIAHGYFSFNNCEFELVDLPGTYSIDANSPDEEVARDEICSGKDDCVIVVADATCLERNLNLVLQILEITSKVVVCVNLIDEARKKHINIDVDELSLQLGVPVVCTAARSKKGLNELIENIYLVSTGQKQTFSVKTHYNILTEKAVEMIETELKKQEKHYINSRWLAAELLDEKKQKNIISQFHIEMNDKMISVLNSARKLTENNGDICDKIKEAIIKRSENIYKLCVHLDCTSYSERDRKIDRIVTSKATGIPIMLLLFGLIFYITIIGANYPSEWLSMLFEFIQIKLYELFSFWNVPPFFVGLFIDGMYRTLANVISVMLPPMAIFFPLFALLEDSGYLPRIAFNLDKFFCRAGANGKQSLTMMMGMGCNACGVTGCRIIESERERKIAILTNNFSPCNGRFPTIIAIITMFFVGNSPLELRSALCTFILIGVILFSIVLSLFVSKILSVTILKGKSDSFILELPPYRRPQIVKTIVRSLCDKTIFILGRAAAVAVPAGIIIWLLANIYIGDKTLIIYASEFLDPFAQIMGLDGVILMSFILGFPANEIVIPIAIMIYMSTGSITGYESLFQLQTILADNGWTLVTALCTMIFSIMHFPCSTTCITIYKETKSIKLTLLSVIIPTLCGILCCMLINLIAHIFI